MSTPQFLLDRENSDWKLYENIKERRPDNHIPDDAASGALAVSYNTGTLGDGGAALSVAAGAVVVDDTEHSISQQTVDVGLGDSQPRRDVVYATGSGNIAVLRGTPASYAWGAGVSSTQENKANAFLPAPRSFGPSTTGVPLAVVTVPGNSATSLPDEPSTLEDVRAWEPVYANITTLDGVETLNRTHYAGEGDDLQAALDALPAREELIIEGRHTIDGSLTISTDSIITVNGQITLADGVYDSIFNASDIENVIVQGTGELIGNKQTLDAGGSQNAPGINFDAPLHNIIVRDITVRNTRDAGMHLGASNNILVGNVNVRNTGLPSELADGIFMRGNYARVTNSEIRNVRDSCIAIGITQQFTVTGNVLYNEDSYNTNVNNMKQCLGFTSAVRPCQGTVAGNVMGNPGASTGTAIVTDFDYENANQTDNEDRHVSVTGNYLWGETPYGAHLMDSPEITFTGNVLELASSVNPVGIRFGGGVVANNTIRGAADGIIADSGQKPGTIVGNHIYAPSQQGVVLPNSNMRVIGNMVSSPGSTGFSVGESGVARSGYSLLGNYAENGGADGIKLLGDVTDSAVIGNRVTGCADFGANTNASDDHNAWGFNVLRGNTGGAFDGSFGAATVVSGNVPATWNDRETVLGPRTTNYTASHGDVVLLDTSGGDVTVTLPSPAAGKRVTVDNSISASGNSMIIESPGSGTIDGNTQGSGASEGGSRDLVCDGTDWWAV